MNNSNSSSAKGAFLFALGSALFVAAPTFKQLVEYAKTPELATGAESVVIENQDLSRTISIAKADIGKTPGDFFRRNEKVKLPVDEKTESLLYSDLLVLHKDIIDPKKALQNFSLISKGQNAWMDAMHNTWNSPKAKALVFALLIKSAKANKVEEVTEILKVVNELGITESFLKAAVNIPSEGSPILGIAAEDFTGCQHFAKTIDQIVVKKTSQVEDNQNGLEVLLDKLSFIITACKKEEVSKNFMDALILALQSNQDLEKFKDANAIRVLANKIFQVKSSPDAIINLIKEEKCPEVSSQDEGAKRSDKLGEDFILLAKPWLLKFFDTNVSVEDILKICAYESVSEVPDILASTAVADIEDEQAQDLEQDKVFNQDEQGLEQISSPTADDLFLSEAGHEFDLNLHDAKLPMELAGELM